MRRFTPLAFTEFNGMFANPTGVLALDLTINAGFEAQ